MLDRTTAAALNGSRTTIAQALREGATLLAECGIEGAPLDAEVLLCHVLAVEREHLHVISGRLLCEPAAERYRDLTKRRGLREPVAYITGKKEFWSLDLSVTPDVLIPRPETELLVEVCLKLASQGQAVLKRPRGDAREKSLTLSLSRLRERERVRVPLRILELGTGSGAIAISMAQELESAEIVATDVSAAALTVAQKNAARHGVAGRVELLEGDLFGAIPAERQFDFVVSNPPYVRSGEVQTLPSDIRNWEPLVALDGGKDGLDYYRRIAAEAHHYLVEDGYLVLEIGSDMARDLARIFSETEHYAAPRVYQDYSGRDRVFATTVLSSPK